MAVGWEISCKWLLHILVCAVMWGLYVDMHVQYGRHICSGPYANNQMYVILVFVFTLLNAVASYESCILTPRCHLDMN